MNARLLYREGTAKGATPAALVARLYEQTIDDLWHALKALESNDIELRTNKINHAVLVIGHLESQLDFAAGGKVAEHLKNFYVSLRQNLTQAQLQQSKTLLSQQITDLLAIREAWVEVERAQNSVAAENALPAGAWGSGSETSHRDWNG